MNDDIVQGTAGPEHTGERRWTADASGTRFSGPSVEGREYINPAPWHLDEVETVVWRPDGSWRIYNPTPETMERIREAGTWRVGRKVGRTVYRGDQLIGVMDTPELAQQVVEAVNATLDFSLKADG